MVAAYELVAAHKCFFLAYGDSQIRIYAEIEGGLCPMRYVSAHHLDEFDTVTRPIINGALYALVYDEQPEPRLTVDYPDERVKIDVWTGETMDGDIGRSRLAVALRLVESESKRLSLAWQEMHRVAESAKRLLALADHMDALPPEQYDQTRTEHDDGSPACLLAHALYLFAPKQWNRWRERRRPDFMKAQAGRVLGLDGSDVSGLYHGRPLGFDERSPTAREAAAMLRRLAEGRSLDWRLAVNGL